MKLICPTLTLLLSLAACAQPHSGPATTSGTQPVKGQPATPQAAVDPTLAPQLREKAAAVLIAAAAVPTTDTTDPAQNALRANAIEGLLPMPGRLEPILRASFTDKSIGIRSVAAMAAGKAKIRGLVDSLQPLTKDDSPLVRAAATYALQRNGAASDPTLLASMLVSGDTQQRALAAFILGELGNSSAIPMLMAAANRPSGTGEGIRDKLMRLQVAEALVKLGKKDAIDEVRAALYPSQAEEVEATALAIQIIGQVRDMDSIPQLHNLIAEGNKSKNPMPIEVRLAASASLARMGSNEMDAVVLESIASPSAQVRSMAAIVLGETRDRHQLSVLAPLLSDPEAQVRISSAAAIVKITDAPR
jgi:HEAT repeat protein